MEAVTVAVLPDTQRDLLEDALPDWLEPLWWSSPDELEELAPRAEIGWFDLLEKPPALRALASATDLRWLNTAFAGVDWLPLDDLKRRGVLLTNGSGVNANTVAEFTALGMLAQARGYRAIARAQDRHEWLGNAPRTRELKGDRALIFGAGAIGSRISEILRGFGMETAFVRSRATGDAYGPENFREHLGRFQWLVLALPNTPGTGGLFDRLAFERLAPETVLVNVGRAEVIDQDAMLDALRSGRLGGAVLDLTDPEPLPPEHPLWSFENVDITMHLAGFPTPANRARAAERFVTNCNRFRDGEAMESRVDLEAGY